MLTFEQILQAYDRGEFTRNEFIGHTLTALASVQPETVERALRRRPEDLDALMKWIEDVLSGAEIWSSAGHAVPITDDNRAALTRFRGHVGVS